MSTLQYAEALESADITFRALTSNDAEQYRALRLKALQTEGHWFTANLEQESVQTIEEWAACCDETTDRVTLAAFVGDQLIGTTAIEAHDDHIAKWKSTYIEPALRRAVTGILLAQKQADDDRGQRA